MYGFSQAHNFIEEWLRKVWGMKKMHSQKFLICFFVLLLFGCAKFQDFTKLDSFETTSRAYSHAIRWSEFEDAAVFLKTSEDDSDSRSRGYEYKKMIRVTDYIIRKTAVSDDQTKVFQIVDVTYYRNDSMIVKTIRENELWEWNVESQKWELSSGLPKFK